MEQGLHRVLPEAVVDKIPIADGGEGTTQTLVAATGGLLQKTTVRGPLGELVVAEWGLLGDRQTAVVEMAAASGLPLVPIEKRNPLQTTTFGVGQLILAALQQGCEQIILGIGGSATTDFGTGMAQALGVKFIARDGREITQPMTGDLMGQVERIDMAGLNPALDRIRIKVACDVHNPLLGPGGAVYTYSPQKGADPMMCQVLEEHMIHISELAAKTLQDVRHIPGSGAAGGLGGGLVAFLGAELQSGVQLILESCRFSERLQGASLVLTGEGKIDRQTLFGKTIFGVTQMTKRQRIPTIAIVGSNNASSKDLDDLGLMACFSICDKPMDLQTALQEAQILIARTTEQITRTFFRTNQ